MKMHIAATVCKVALLVAWLASMVLFQPCLAEASGSSKPFNRVVIGVDTSGSYKSRIAEAMAKVTALLDEMAKRRVKRWETSDQVILISLDAIPEVVWEGPASELSRVDPATWAKRFKGRSDYSACTDVERFLNLSASKLSAEPAPAEKYLIVFSDLKAEPPLDSPRKCSKPVPAAQVAKAIDWDQFSDVSISVFWMPIAMKYAWGKALADQGVNSEIKLYSESESGIQSLNAPKAATRKVSEGERERVKGQVVIAGTAFVTYLAYAMGLLIAGTAIVFGLAHLLRSRRGGTGNPPMNARGRVPPLVLPQVVRTAGPAPAQAKRPNRGGI